MSTTIEKPVGAPYDQDETSSFDMNYTQAAPRRANEIGAARLFSYRVVDGQRVEYFADRPTVNRNTFPIEGHVDVRNWNTRNTEHELVGIATVIDSQGEYADAYARLYDSFQDELGAGIKDVDIAKAAYQTVLKNIKYDLTATEQTYKFVRDNPDTGVSNRVDLGEYIDQGYGVCNEMMLMAGWILGEAAQRGQMSSGVKVSCHINQETKAYMGAHAWVRVTLPTGEVYIADPAQHFFGTLEQALEDKQRGEQRWEYFTDKGERDRYRAKLAGKATTTQVEVTPDADPDKLKIIQTNGRFYGLKRDGKLIRHMEPVNYIVKDGKVIVHLMVKEEGRNVDDAAIFCALPLKEFIDLQPPGVMREQAEADYNNFMSNTRGKSDTKEVPRPEITSETKLQAEIRDQIADVEAELAKVEGEYQQLQTMAGNHLNALEMVGLYMARKRDAQARDDGQMSNDMEREAGKYYRQLPRELQNQWQRFWNLSTEIEAYQQRIVELRAQYKSSGLIASVPR